MKSNKGKPLDYTKKYKFWEREKPKIQSDFLCRPYIFGLLKSIQNKNIADIGCGEGYVCRFLASKGAKVIGIDNSEGLINSAKEREKKDNYRIKYYLGSALNLNMVKTNSVDLALSVLVFGHFTYPEMNKSIKETYRILKNQGEFILAVPHPFMYVCKLKSNWISFNYSKLNYWEDKIANISLFTKDRMKFDISAKIHTIESYLNSLLDNGFQIEKILEPQASKKDLKTYPKMWGEETRLPTYLIIKAKKK